MRQLSSTLMLLVMVEGVVFFGMIWNHPAAGWHTWFVVAMLLTAAGLLYSWAAERAQASTSRLGRSALILLALSTSAGIVYLLAVIALVH